MYENSENHHQKDDSLIFFQILSTFFKEMYGDTCGEFVTIWISGALSVKMKRGNGLVRYTGPEYLHFINIFLITFELAHD